MERRKHDTGRYPDRRRSSRHTDDDTVITPTIITPTYDSYSPDPVVDYSTPTTPTPDWSGGGGGFDGGGASGTW